METEGAQAEVSWPGFEKFNNVQGILDRNKLLINEINHNHDRRSPEGLARNVQLIRELNENIAMVRSSRRAPFPRSPWGSLDPATGPPLRPQALNSLCTYVLRFFTLPRAPPLRNPWNRGSRPTERAASSTLALPAPCHGCSGREGARAARG
mmetsp:Transcript_13229/g.41839  ORF Transcript_13229/g.41839 Transcript_13229/m.41839 type:complete len:152 (-) Transcript_13229:236-691(-)